MHDKVIKIGIYPYIFTPQKNGRVHALSFKADAYERVTAIATHSKSEKCVFV